MHPGYKYALFSSALFLLASLALPFFTRGDAQNTPLVPAAVTSSTTVISSLVMGAIFSSIFNDKHLTKKLVAERNRSATELQEALEQHTKALEDAEESHKRELDHLRRSVLGQAGQINVSVYAADSIAQDVLEQTTDAAAAAYSIRNQIFHLRMSIASSVGAIFNAFGRSYRDGLQEMDDHSSQGMIRIRLNGRVAPPEQILLVPREKVESLGTSQMLAPAEDQMRTPSKVSRISVTCPRCGRTVQGVRARLLEAEVKCFCPHCDASIEIAMPSRTPHLVGELNWVAGPEIIGRRHDRPLLRCPDCGEILAAFTLIAGRHFAICGDDNNLLTVTHGQFRAFVEET